VKSEAIMAKDLERYDASALIGLPVIVVNGAKEITETGDDGEPETYVHIHQMEELAAAAAMARCLMPHRLRGCEIRAVRKILGLTARELSDAMGENTAVETISRWEAETVVPGGYAEKLLRLTVCEALKEKARGVEYDPQKLIRTHMIECDRTKPNTAPKMVFKRVLVKSDKKLDDSWTELKAA
jgi:DNA-binding transcriptional regulator YiaG